MPELTRAFYGKIFDVHTYNSNICRVNVQLLCMFEHIECHLVTIVKTSREWVLWGQAISEIGKQNQYL